MSFLRALRPFLVGLFLIPFCCYWAQDQPIDRIFSLMVPPLALTLVVAVVNAGVGKLSKRLVMSGGEIVVVYALLAVACAMSGEWMDMVATQVYGYAIYAENNPRYETQILPWLPKWLFFTSADGLKDFATGGKRFDIFWRDLPLWLPKAGAWTLLLSLVSGALMAINSLLKDQWIHRERLAFPIVQLPLAIAMGNQGQSLHKSRLFWIGLAATFSVDMINGLSFLYPQIPSINVRFLGDMNGWFSRPPWNQTGWTPIGIFPFMSALGFFMPTDLLFSLLFFFFFRKAQQIVSYSLGNEQGTFGGGGLVPSAPYFSEQSWGAFLGLFVSGLWLARPHLKEVWRAIQTGERKSGEVPHRFSFVMLLTCIAGMGVVGALIGLPVWFVLLYLSLFLAFSLAVTRLRAQLGAPTHEMAFMGPHQIVLDFHGSAGLGNDLVTRTLTVFHFMNRIHRTHPQPALLEGVYLAERTGMAPRVMFAALCFAVPIGTCAGFLMHVYLGYRWIPVSWPSGEVAGVINSVLSTPRPPNPSAILGIGAGFAVVMALDFVRFRIPGFWLHPAGYALAMNFGVDYYWFGLLIVLVVKVFVTRFYGLKGYDQLRQLAFGLIVGEIAAELIWAIFSMLNDRQATYSISINGKLGWNQ